MLVTGFFDGTRKMAEDPTLPQFNAPQLNTPHLKSTNSSNVGTDTSVSGFDTSSFERETDSSSRLPISELDEQFLMDVTAALDVVDMFSCDPAIGARGSDDCIEPAVCPGSSWFSEGSVRFGETPARAADFPYVKPETLSEGVLSPREGGGPPAVYANRGGIQVSSGGELDNKDLNQILRVNFSDMSTFQLPPVFTQTTTRPLAEPTAVHASRASDSGRTSRERRSPVRRTTPGVRSSGAGSSKSRRRHKHPCPYCEKNLDTKYKLERHVRTHTGEKPFECEVCKTRFNQKSSLKTHSTIHAKAFLRTPGSSMEMVENYTVNGHTLEALGIPYASYVYDRIQNQVE